jgi:hypothetical protein
MKAISLVVALAAAAAFAEPRALFNGKDLSGWKVAPFDAKSTERFFTVMSGALDPVVM